jgi:hypothetical protein
MLIDGPEIPLKQLAAERAWFTLGVADIDSIASHLRAPPDVKSHDGTLLDAGVKLTQHVLQCGEGKALDIMSQRIKVMDDSCTVIDEFMELDEAAKNLTAEDEKKLKTEKRDLIDKQHDFHTFKQAFHARRAAVRARDGAG